MLFQTYALWEYLLSGLCRPKIRLHVMCSMIVIYAVRKRPANRTQRPKSSSWNSPRPFYYSACIREVFTLQRPAKKLWAELRVNQDTTVCRSTI